MTDDQLKSDTIAAIATPIGQGGIGIVRMSGPRAEEIALRIFKPRKQGKRLESHRLYLGHVIDPCSGDMIDEALLSLMKAPHSYTREDVVEINSHSGHFLLSRILQIVLRLGARLARPGEFTFRAFINGRIDLTQAEAVVDLINSKSAKGILLASQQINGAFKSQIQGLRQKAVDILARTEVAIDFPEEEAEIIPREETDLGIGETLIAPIERLIAAHAGRKVWIDGVDTVIAGAVNVGKSSLLNRLLDENRAIVTPVPGTTRDVIEAMLQVEGIPLRLMDTAGIRKVRGKVERVGIRLSRQKLAEADLSLIVIDQSRPINRDDMDIIEGSKTKRALILINKIDLPSRLDEEDLVKRLNGSPLVRVSALTGEGIDHLRRAIRAQIVEGDIDNTSSHVIPNLRHKEALQEAATCFRNAAYNVREGMPMEIVAVDLKSGSEALGDIIGETTGEEVLDRIFSRFCLGK